MLLTLYLAGPDVFAPDAAVRFDSMRADCRALGFEPLTPVDNALPEGLQPAAQAAFIKQANVTLIRRCDAVVANITPFRGPNMDPGTAWEIGFAEALGKPVFLWSETPALLAERTAGRNGVDAAGWMIEDFGLTENLMIAVTPRPLARSFADALASVAAARAGN
jgi:nucleoside 2-deoxyribosyltransferase